MLSCVPRVRAATHDYLFDRAQRLSDNAWKNFLAESMYVHWPTICKHLKNKKINEDQIARRILSAWEADKIIPIPHGDDCDELPSLVRLDECFPDNVYVFCLTFDEYVNLRKNFGREDIGGFSLDV